MPLPAGARYEAAFSPGQAMPLMLDTIGAAKTSIAVAVYSFTSKPIAEALLQAHRRGVKVALVVDAGDAGKTYSAARFLGNQGVPVRTNGRYAIHHHKFLVVDGTTVQTGSFNYTASAAARNAENVLVISNAPGLAATYTTEWKRLWEEGDPMQPNY